MQADTYMVAHTWWYIYMVVHMGLCIHGGAYMVVDIGWCIQGGACTGCTQCSAHSVMCRS